MFPLAENIVDLVDLLHEKCCLWWKIVMMKTFSQDYLLEEITDD